MCGFFLNKCLVKPSSFLDLQEIMSSDRWRWLRHKGHGLAEAVTPKADTGSGLGRGRPLTAGGFTREESMLEIAQVSVGDEAPTDVYANHQPTDSSPNGKNSSAAVMRNSQMEMTAHMESHE